jgi:hypothetical protein
MILQTPEIGDPKMTDKQVPKPLDPPLCFHVLTWLSSLTPVTNSISSCKTLHGVSSDTSEDDIAVHGITGTALHISCLQTHHQHTLIASLPTSVLRLLCCPCPVPIQR